MAIRLRTGTATALGASKLHANHRRSIPVLLVSLGVVAGACSDDNPTASSARRTTEPDPSGAVDVPEESSDGDGGSGRTTVTPGGGGRGRSAGLRLAPFSDCSAFLDHVKQQARDRVGPYGLDPYGYPFAVADVAATVPVSEDGMAPQATMAPSATAQPEAATADAAFGDDDSAGGTDQSGRVTGTNTQEEGVEEPDIIKTDGNRILTVTDNVLRYIDITGDQPVMTSTLTLPEGWGHQLFLAGDRAILITNSGMWGQPMPVDFAVDQELTEDASWAGNRPAALVIEVDLSDPAAMRVAATLRVEGQYLNARAIGDRLLLALSSGPQWMPWVMPQSQSGENAARQANQRAIDESTLADWVPEFSLDVSGSITTGQLLTCEQLHHPAEFAGFDVISVISLDVAGGLAGGYDPTQASGVLAGGQTVYASLDRFYVATTEWIALDVAQGDQFAPQGDEFETELHAFAIDPGSPLTYLASGSVPGTLLNSFSLDEHEGYLRVLTTEGAPWGRSESSETRLTVLAEEGDRLVPVGDVGGLGRGESLYSARLVGDRGFAVTFRQVDPFYVLDLSDPTNPQVTGELKIPGFSTYLHPVGEHRVLGVGRNATDDGMVLGLKLSLFDVSDPANPAEISTWTLDGAYSMAEYDHHAFQMIGSTAILPVESPTDAFVGAIVFDIGDAITERGRISHVNPGDQPTSDCRQLSEGDVSEQSGLYWYSVDTYTRTFLCGPNEVGGYGNWYCDRVTLDNLINWTGFDASDEVRQLVPDADRVEFCYDQGSYAQAIQRSVVIDSTLWTMSVSSLAAHDLDTLEPIASVSLG